MRKISQIISIIFILTILVGCGGPPLPSLTTMYDPMTFPKTGEGYSFTVTPISEQEAINPTSSSDDLAYYQVAVLKPIDTTGKETVVVSTVATYPGIDLRKYNTENVQYLYFMVSQTNVEPNTVVPFIDPDSYWIMSKLCLATAAALQANSICF